MHIGAKFINRITGKSSWGEKA